MKKLLTLIIVCLFCCMASYGQTTASQEEEKKDSMINIVGYFCKNDTLTYWIHEGEWKVAEGDTTRTNNVSTKVMITVTDSTKNGYAMEYTFLDFKYSPDSTELSGITGGLISKIGDKIKGTVIKFHTDEVGHITKYDNLKEIKKQAKQLYKEGLKEIPFIDSLKTIGIDIKAITKMVDTERLVDGYTEELELLLKWHGNGFPVGENKNHEDATADAYASDTYTYVSVDEETGDYSFSYDINQYIPAEDVKELIGAVYETFAKEEMPDSLEQGFDEFVKGPLTYTTSYSADYFWNGWPKKVISQTESVFTGVGRGKLKQTLIEWDSVSTGNY